MERELWAELSAAISDVQRSFKANARLTFSIALIVRVYLWAVLHDRPVYWACRPQNWSPQTRPKTLPSQSTMSRRIRTQAFQDFLNALSRRMAGKPSVKLLKYIDGKPLTVANHSTDPDAKSGRGASGQAKGYKLHAITDGGPMPVTFEIQPLNVSEQAVAKRLIPQLRDGGYLLGDANYDGSELFDIAAGVNHQLVAPRRKPHTQLGHHYQSKHRLRSIDMLERSPNRPCAFGRTLYKERKCIERDFGNAVSFGGGLTTGLPAFVRRLDRVSRWVHAKLLINAARIRIRRKQTAIAA